MRRTGFTLIELLVVITIIVVLLALLTPALDKAIERAQRAVCLSNQRNLAMSSKTYAVEHKRILPPSYLPNPNPGADQPLWSFSYDLRSINEPAPYAMLDTNEPIGPGLLMSGGYLIGKIAHCPTYDNSVSPGNGHCMDVIHANGRGGSWFDDESYTARIIMGYHYRGGSYYWDKGHMRLGKLGSAFALYVDIVDARPQLSGAAFGHRTGYQRTFADGSAGWYPDPYHVLENEVNLNGNGNFDGRVGHQGYGNRHNDENVWDALALPQAPEPASTSP